MESNGPFKVVWNSVDSVTKLIQSRSRETPFETEEKTFRKKQQIISVELHLNV